MRERISTERVRELVESATPGPWRGDRNDGTVKYAILAGEHDAPIVVLTCDYKNACYGFGCGDDYGEAECAADPDADERLTLAAPDLAADLIDARERIAALEVERDEARRMLGECYAISGADTDGDGWDRLWPHAVENARETRQLHDAASAEELAVSDALRAKVKALEAERDARVPAEEHARAVRGAYFEGRSDAPEDYWTATKSKRDHANGWLSSNALGDVLATLTRHVGPERAAALVDGGSDV